MAGLKDQKAGTYSLGVMGAGVAAFIFSFFPFYGIDLGVVSATANAWHGAALIGMLLLLAAAALVAVRTFAAGVQMPNISVGWGFVVLAASALGTLLVLLRFVTLPAFTGLRFGAFLVLIAGLAETGCAFLAMRAASEPMPWEQKRPGAAPQPPAV